MRKKSVILLQFFIAMHFFVTASFMFSENPGQYKKTALRCISIAKNLLVQEDYENACAQAELGLAYDDTIADLYYIKALSLAVRGLPAYMIEKPLSASLQNNWYDYNKNAAILLLAQLYIKTGRAAEALFLLNEKPVLSGKEALYTRTKALYLLGDIAAARENIKKGAFQFPGDERFALLFFDCEKFLEKQRDDKTFEELVSLFLLRASSLQDSDPDILLKASFFSSGESQIRLLKAWNAYGNVNPWYAVYALRAGLLNETQAFEYMLPFLNDTVDYECLNSFVSLISSEEVKERLSSFYAVFEGIIVFDTDKDGISDMKVQYRSGRPSFVEYDKNQDGLLDWIVDCDYGVPVKLQLLNKTATLWYGTWPAIARVVCADEVYDIRENCLFGTPVTMVKDSVMQMHGGTVLYIPVLQDDFHNMDTSKEILFSLSHTVERKTSEYENSSVRFSLFDGKAKSAVYTDKGTPYAYAFFENGILRFRNVDRDKNGSCEITEIYAFDPEKAERYRNTDDEILMSRRLFGSENSASGLYLQKIVSDTDSDGKSEFIEEYGQNGTLSVSWENSDTGNWNIRYMRHSDISEQIEYVHPVMGKRVKLMLENGSPVSLNGVSVIKDPETSFFWIGEYPGKNYAQKLMQTLNQKGSSGVIVTVTDLIWFKEKDRFFRIFAVKNGDTYFGEVLYE